MGKILRCIWMASLQKRTVDVDDGPQADFGLPCRKRDGVRFADPHIEESIWEFLADGLKFVSLTHRSRNHRDAFIVTHLIGNRIPRVIGVSLTAG